MVGTLAGGSIFPYFLVAATAAATASTSSSSVETVTVTATEAERYVPNDTSHDDDAQLPPHNPQLTIGGAFPGFCTRAGSDTSGAGLCGEGEAGLRLSASARVHFLFEGFVGGNPRTQWGDAVLGTSTTSGGFYIGGRALMEYDASLHFFFRAGAQLRDFPEIARGGGAGLFDVGTFVPLRKAGRGLELAIEAMFGADAVARTTGGTSVGGASFTMGTSLVMRGRL